MNELLSYPGKHGPAGSELTQLTFPRNLVKKEMQGAGAMAHYSHPSVTPVPGDRMLSSDLLGHQGCTWYTYIHADKTHMK